MTEEKTGFKGRAFIRAALLFVVIFCGILGAALIWHPESKLPAGWNPVSPLMVSGAPGPFTAWKLRRTAANPVACMTALDQAATITGTAPVESENSNCGIVRPVTIGGVGRSRIGLQTDCATALRLAMWERHGLQPAAARHFDSQVTAIQDIGSYSCRRMNTTSGTSNRWSSHARAMAVDVRGVTLADGTRIDLLRDWQGEGPKAAFLRDAMKSACTWFVTALGPDYNRLHADHFHLQATGWGTCR